MKNEWSPEELMRLMNGLEDLGLNSKEILDFICWIGTGDEKYKPISRKKQPSM